MGSDQLVYLRFGVSKGDWVFVRDPGLYPRSVARCGGIVVRVENVGGAAHDYRFGALVSYFVVVDVGMGLDFT